MSKTDPDELSKLITPELATYLGAGQLNADRLANALDYSGVRIDNFDQLKQLHFALSDDVVGFVDKLETRLRRVKTEHQRVTETTHGEVRGPVNWPQTHQQRPKTGDLTLFVINNPEIEFDIPENRVVKKLIAIIAEPLTRDIEGRNQDWRAMWDDTDIVDLKQTLEHNVYLDQLPDAREISVTDRDLVKARRSRHRLYSQAAELYQLYDDLLNDRYEQDDVRELLRETIVTPTDDAVLFELFCVFGELKRLRDTYPELTLQRVERGMDEIALLDSQDRRVSIFYDQGGPLSFFTALFDPTELRDCWDVPKPIVRHSEALQKHENLIGTFLEEGRQHSYYQGRPDLVVLEYTKSDGAEELSSIRLGEIKFTRSRATFSTGLRELSEYIYLMQLKDSDDDEFLFGDRLPEDAVKGTLFTDGVPTATDTTEIVDHYSTEDLRRLFN